MSGLHDGKSMLTGCGAVDETRRARRRAGDRVCVKLAQAGMAEELRTRRAGSSRVQADSTP
ncbi:hypothetical protein TRAPUB_9176 [Trametes pubescens]|uniref:Uncharacterized protein n=1 Tax=Trametes pubescens TaxID=154538 RepID=A0A1M2W380_TRAPU|nr:hypothetical protein TRAPUB_9176 [Trametes pubescens]